MLPVGCHNAQQAQQLFLMSSQYYSEPNLYRNAIYRPTALDTDDHNGKVNVSFACFNAAGHYSHKMLVTGRPTSAARSILSSRDTCSLEWSLVWTVECRHCC